MNNTTKATPAELRLMYISEHLITVFFDRMKSAGGIYSHHDSLILDLASLVRMFVDRRGLTYAASVVLRRTIRQIKPTIVLNEPFFFTFTEIADATTANI